LHIISEKHAGSTTARYILKGKVRGGIRYIIYPRQQAEAPAKAQEQVREGRSASTQPKKKDFTYTSYDL
jgi:hypothetical protein